MYNSKICWSVNNNYCTESQLPRKQHFVDRNEVSIQWVWGGYGNITESIKTKPCLPTRCPVVNNSPIILICDTNMDTGHASLPTRNLALVTSAVTACLRVKQNLIKTPQCLCVTTFSISSTKLHLSKFTEI